MIKIKKTWVQINKNAEILLDTCVCLKKSVQTIKSRVATSHFHAAQILELDS